MFKIIALVGHSGSGKTTIQEAAAKLGCNNSLGMKTRPYRKGETESDYTMVTPEFFLQEHGKGKVFGEVIYNGHLYGTHESEIESKRINIFPVTPDGLIALKKRFKKKFITSIFLDASPELRLERMLARGDTVTQANQRIKLDDKIFANAFHLTDYRISSGTKEEDIVEFIDIIREIKEDAYLM